MTIIPEMPSGAQTVIGATLACLMLGVLQSAGQASAAAVITTDVRAGLHDDRTRIVLDLSRSVDVRLFTLASPYRVVVDLPETAWQLPSQPLPGDIGILRTMRYALHQPGQSRLVIETSAPPSIREGFYLVGGVGKPYRFVLEIAATDLASFARRSGQTTVIAANARAGPTAPAALPKTVATKPENRMPAGPRKPPAPKRPAKRVVVIDAGHGGADPGAIGRSGVYEKDITLAFSRVMKTVIEASGRYRVHLVRDRDVYIPLRERIARARRANADLFISLHADSIRNPATRGLSVYTLSEKASDREAALLAEKENKADIVAGMDFNNEPPEVANILIDLAQRESMNESARFANILIGGATRVTKVLRNTHRFAGFVVLKAPDVPSVLVELGFLSNRTDEKKLQSRTYRQKFAEAALRSLDDYFAGIQQAHTH